MHSITYRTLGRSGLRVSPLALGTMTFGDPGWGSDEETSFALIDQYLDAGGNLIDTANGYVEGKSEEVIGTYFAKHPERRDRIVLSTKFASNAHNFDPNGGGGSRKAVLHQVESSLERLRTDYIDLCWMHHWDRHTPIDETMAVMDDLIRVGKVRYFGMSNNPAWNIARAATIAELRGWANLVAIQVDYSLLERTVEGEQFGVARALGLGVTPYSPLAHGVLSGKYSRENPEPAGAGRPKLAAPHLTERTFAVLDVLREIAGQQEVSMAAVALAWVRQQPEVTSTLLGARTAAQLDDNLSSLAVTIGDEHLAVLDGLTTPTLNYPADHATRIGIPRQQAGTTINGLESTLFVRP